MPDSDIDQLLESSSPVDKITKAIADVYINDDFNAPRQEDVDIEILNNLPPFLKGQSRGRSEFSSVRIVKALEGFLNRAAMKGAALTKERWELKQLSVNKEAATESVSGDVSKSWLDPMSSGTNKVSSRPIMFGEKKNIGIQEQRKNLPIYSLKESLLKAIEEHQVLVVVGDTGSGKTTQIVQYLTEAGYADKGRIGCTQPREVSARSAAKRVSEEVGCKLGHKVGYTIGFEDVTTPETKIKFMTDAILQREYLHDPLCSSYSVIVLDDAHERTIATDVLFGLLKGTLKKRPDLKLMITSATMDAAKFSRYFCGCPIFAIPNQTYPVEILYCKEPEEDYFEASLITVMQLHLSEPSCDILLFLTKQEEIDSACEALYERMKALGPKVPELIILPVYSTLPSEVQSRVVEHTPAGSRKVVIATNIAETTLPIPGIYYVIDSGVVKQTVCDPRLGMDSFVVTPISQAQARQRASRAGRAGPGKCFRLYTEAAYRNEMYPITIPDIQKADISETVLQLIAMGINDPMKFGFLDSPPQDLMVVVLNLLYELSALDEDGLLTDVGSKMAKFPLDPRLAKMLVASVEYQCSEEILTIVAMLSVRKIFYYPGDKKEQAESQKAKFHQPEGDHLTLLATYDAWKASNFSKAWCSANFIQQHSMDRARHVREQLVAFMNKHGYSILSAGSDSKRILKTICAGFFRNVARKDPQGGYKTLVEGTPVYLHLSSPVFNRGPQWLVYNEVVLTNKEYCHIVSTIEPRWLIEVAPQLFKVSMNKNESKAEAEED